MTDKHTIPKAVISSSTPKVDTGFGKKLNAVIYCRVSSVAQLKKGDGLASQETRCREHASYAQKLVTAVIRRRFEVA